MLLTIKDAKYAKLKVLETIKKLNLDKSVSSVGIGKTKNDSYAIIVQIEKISDWIGWPSVIKINEQIKVPVILKESKQPMAQKEI